MSNEVNAEALMEKWQEIHGELDVFQKDLFVEHISIPKLQDFEMVEIEKAWHIRGILAGIPRRNALFNSLAAIFGSRVVDLRK